MVQTVYSLLKGPVPTPLDKNSVTRGNCNDNALVPTVGIVVPDLVPGLVFCRPAHIGRSVQARMNAGPSSSSSTWYQR